MFRFVALLGALASAGRANERIYSRDFRVGADCVLILHTYHGAVRVHPAPVGTIQVKTQVSAGVSDDHEFARILGAFHWNAQSDGRQVTVDVTGPDLHFVWRENEDLEVTFDITVPLRCAVEVVDGNGSVEIGNLQGSAHVQTQRGIVYLKHIDGDVVASTSESALVLGACAGSARLSDQKGDIRVGPVDGALDATAVSGDIDVLLAKGRTSLKTNSGDITLGLPKRVGGDIDVRTNSGDITLKVNRAASATFHLTSVWGHVHAGVPIQVQAGGDGKSNLDGQLNAGGPLVTLRADGGHILIEPSRS
ncbi:MAG TPA: DUF4097 family beta strand repeat-containing protein [Opitutaceae bacterium]